MIVTFDAPADTVTAAVTSVAVGGGVDLVVLVDNAATGRPAPPLPELGVPVRHVAAGRNGGFGTGANLGIAEALRAGATFVALLNDDLVVEPGWLDPLLEEMDRAPGVGAVQPKLLITGSDPPRVNSVGVRLGRDGAGRDIGFGELDGAQFSSPSDIPAFTGGAVLLRAAFLHDVGPFDERLFMYYEDVDLSLRGAARGWAFRCRPDSRVWHQVSASAAAMGWRTVYYQERNRLWLLARYGSAADTARGLWLSARRLRHEPRGAHRRALAAGLAGMPRAWLARISDRRRRAPSPRG